MRLIDADALEIKSRGNNSQRVMWQNIKRIIREAPTIDAKPMKNSDLNCESTGEIRAILKAKWIVFSYEQKHIKCSNCLFYWAIPEHKNVFKYCPNCGAKMEGELKCF